MMLRSNFLDLPLFAHKITAGAGGYEIMYLLLGSYCGWGCYCEGYYYC